MDPAPITFIELAGAGARERLTDLATLAAERGSRCELLVSEEQRDLYLLLCRGEAEPPPAPAGARTWSFRPVRVAS
jgi:hypothetical protein